jgi:hypothetical protein
MPVLTDELVDSLANPDINYWEVFGPDADEDSIGECYRQLALRLHPDRGGDKTVFQRLVTLKNDAKQALIQGRYGEPLVLAVFRTKKAEHKVKTQMGVGDIATLYYAQTTTENGEMSTVMKVARNAKDNDLMAAEARALKKLHEPDDQLVRHFPLLLDSFLYPDGRRRANVYQHQDRCFTLEQVHQAHPTLDPVHLVWIWRRILMALGFANQQDILHGATLPPHILIYPEQHGVILLDWCYSVTTDNNTFPHIRAMVPGYQDWYPEEVADKGDPTEATDIALAARSMIYAAGGDPLSREMPFTVPRPLRAFFRGCTQPSQQMRPSNAWILLQEFDTILRRMGSPFYPRRWVDFQMPT